MIQYAYYNENDHHAAEWLRNLISAGLIADGYVDERNVQDVQSADLQGFFQHHFFRRDRSLELLPPAGRLARRCID
jgi:hypothetical protein